MAKYVLKHGKYNTTNDDGTPKIAKKGDTIELSDGQAKAYADMIQPVAVHRAEQKVARDAVVAVAAAEAEVSE